MLIHLTPDKTTLCAIVRDGRLRARTPYGAAYNVPALAQSQAVVCFSELAALESVSELARRHGGFGVGFTKTWLQAYGAAPVWYLSRGSHVQTELFNLVRELAFRIDPDPSHPLWRLTPFVDYPQDAEAGQAASSYDWKWEREWRVRGDVSFESERVALLYAPEAEHPAIKSFWTAQILEARAGNVPPLLDASWAKERQYDVLSSGSTAIEAEVIEPLERWSYDVEATSYFTSDFEEDERRAQQAEMLEEYRGWLDEMAPDDA